MHQREVDQAIFCGKEHFTTYVDSPHLVYTIMPTALWLPWALLQYCTLISSTCVLTSADHILFPPIFITPTFLFSHCFLFSLSHEDTLSKERNVYSLGAFRAWDFDELTLSLNMSPTQKKKDIDITSLWQLHCECVFAFHIIHISLCVCARIPH